MPEITVVIPNWNGRHLLERCLSALKAQTYSDFQVIVVDNGSTDGSVEWLREHWPTVEVIANESNRGFAAPINQGIRANNSRYVAILNNDTQAEPGWLEAMVAAAESDPGVGMVACKLLFADAPDIINSTGLALDWAGFCWDWRGGQLDDPSASAIEERFGPTGGAALYRRAMLNEIGLLDEDFFLYAEDADLAWRAQRAGWRCLYTPAARVYHAASATSGEGSRFKNYMLGRNKVWLFAKNMPGGWRLAWIVLLVVYDLLTLGYGLLTRGDMGAIEGRVAGLQSLPRMIRKRRHSPARANDYLRLIRPLEPPWKIPLRFKHIRARIHAPQSNLGE